jgi:CheY-like chemotaxis protein
LGLPQVHGIVGAHDGYIDVATDLGSGTTVTVYLPALSPDIVATAHGEDEEPLCMGRGETILVVEDNPSARQALTESLQQLQYRVVEAAHGSEALVILTSPTYTIDLVLSDVVMPHMGGAELLQAMAQHGITVPVILVTGHMLKQESILSHNGGDQVEARLAKPVSLEKLSDAICRALSARR